MKGREGVIDFALLKNREQKMSELVKGLTVDDLRLLTNEMVDTILDLIRECQDVDVNYVPDDPEAYDAFAADEADVRIAWTLGHVIVHTTASSEEAAAIACELARGVEYHGRSRSEMAWEKVTTVAQCRHRLEESRRMRLASLDMWPDEPHLDNTQSFIGGDPANAIARFVWGLKHDDDHLGQIFEIVRQAKDARRA
jgi:hypothetical protein